MSARSRANPWWGRRKPYPEELYGPEIKDVWWEGRLYRWSHEIKCRVMG